MAAELYDRVPEVLQDAELWMSDREVEAGQRWSHELSNSLETSAVGVICLTQENLVAPWLLFEAGALARSVSAAKVIPYALDLTPIDIPFPLAQFQSVGTTQDGTFRLLQSINQQLASPLQPERLERIFRRWWPEFERRIASIRLEQPETPRSRDDRELLAEVLELVRRLHASSETTAVESQIRPARSLIWRTLYEVSERELRVMDRPTLEDYLTKLRIRLKSATHVAEEETLENRIDLAQQILRALILTSDS
jgi:hypothetical protein